MTHLKSYTSPEQSKVLANILLLESADMCWFEGQPFVETVTGYEEDRAEAHRQAGMEMYPCWSLAALLGVFPTFTIDSSDDHYFRVHCYIYFSEWHNNPVDACYEMILKLHELKML